MSIISISSILFCSNTFLFSLSSFTFHLLVPLNCNHFSTNHYFPSPSPTPGNTGGFFFFFQLRTLPHQLYCVTLRVCDRKVKCLLQSVILYLSEAGGKDENDYLSHCKLPILSVIMFFFLKCTLSDINIAMLAFYVIVCMMYLFFSFYFQPISFLMFKLQLFFLKKDLSHLITGTRIGDYKSSHKAKPRLRWLLWLNSIKYINKNNMNSL